jgi:hypothetical protein
VSLAVLLAAAAAPDLTICADRPSKANGACTVPALHWQLEVSVIDWTRSSDAGSHSDATSVGQTFVKLGLGDNSDIELGFTPYVRVEQPGPDASGVGDVMVRYKRRLTAADGRFQAAIIPFVKLPTANHSIGNGEVEGGVAMPLSGPIGPITATLGPEVDLLVDADGHGRHPALANLVNLSAAVARRLTLSGELWSSMNFDPDRTQHLWSADASAAYLANTRVQLDAGANLGLNRETPDIEVYGGVSVLF